MNDSNNLPSWPKSFLLAVPWLVAGSAVFGVICTAILVGAEYLKRTEPDSMPYQDMLDWWRFIDSTAFRISIIVAMIISIAAMARSAKVHRTNRVAVWMLIILIIGVVIPGLGYLLVGSVISGLGAGQH